MNDLEIRNTAYAPFRYANFRLLLTGNFLAIFGLQLVSLAVSWDLYVQTKSALVLGNVGFVQVAPFLLFALSAGQFADRYDRKKIMVLSQLLMVVATLLLATAHRSVPVIYSCLFLTALARAIQGPARLAMIPNVIPAPILHRAITWTSSFQEIASVTGPAVAGFLISTVGTAYVYWLQVACALLTLVCFSFLSVQRAAAEPEAASSDASTAVSNLGFTQGLKFVWRDTLVLPAMLLDLLAVLFGGATALLPIYAVDVLHTGAHGLGWLRAAPSIGAVTMAFALSHAGGIKNAGRTLLWSVAGFGAATVVFGLSTSVVLSLAMLFLIGAFDNVSVVLRQSLVQMRTPDQLRGRVLAVNNIFISCSNQLGAVESGWTAQWLGAVPSVVAGGFATIVIAALFAASSVALRSWRQT